MKYRIVEQYDGTWNVEESYSGNVVAVCKSAESAAQVWKHIVYGSGV